MQNHFYSIHNDYYHSLHVMKQQRTLALYCTLGFAALIRILVKAELYLIEINNNEHKPFL